MNITSNSNQEQFQNLKENVINEYFRLNLGTGLFKMSVTLKSTVMIRMVR
jgi:hypothetical protein